MANNQGLRSRRAGDALELLVAGLERIRGAQLSMGAREDAALTLAHLIAEGLVAPNARPEDICDWIAPVIVQSSAEKDALFHYCVTLSRDALRRSDTISRANSRQRFDAPSAADRLVLVDRLVTAGAAVASAAAIYYAWSILSHLDEATQRAFAPFILLGLASVICIGGWRYRGRLVLGAQRARRWLRRDARARTGTPQNLPIATDIEGFATWRAAPLIADALRTLKADDRLELDINRTAVATASHGGRFRPVWRQRPTGRLVILIEWAGGKDHQSARFHALARKIERLRPRTEIWFIERDGERAFQAGAKAGVGFIELVRELAGSIVLFLGDGRSLLGLGGVPRDAARNLINARASALATPVPPLAWGARERKLSTLFSHGLTKAEPSDIQRTVSEMAREAQRAHPRTGAAREPIWALDPEAWTHGSKPNAVEVRRLDKDLDNYFAEAHWPARFSPGRLWLAACAMFPTIRPDLSALFGRRLVDFDGTALFSDRRAMLLSALPWMRAGHMPKWLRKRLVAQTPRYFRRMLSDVVRRTLHEGGTSRDSATIEAVLTDAGAHTHYRDNVLLDTIGRLDPLAIAMPTSAPPRRARPVRGPWAVDERTRFDHFADYVIRRFKDRSGGSSGVWLQLVRFFTFYFAAQRLTRARPLFTLASTPERIRPWYLAWATLHAAGAEAVRKPQDAEVVIHFEDATYSPNEAPVRGPLLINFECRDISKTHVARTFETVFGYPLSVDPTRHVGGAVEKSEINAAHDGRLVQCPTKAVRGRTYQHLIDNRAAANSALVETLTACVVFNAIPSVIVVRRPVEKRFLNVTTSALLRAGDEVFAEEELRLLTTMSQRMGLELGTMDVLRDRRDGRLYVVDVNKTPMGPNIGLPLADKLVLVRGMAGALREQLDKRVQHLGSS